MTHTEGGKGTAERVVRRQSKMERGAKYLRVKLVNKKTVSHVKVSSFCEGEKEGGSRVTNLVQTTIHFTW